MRLKDIAEKIARLDGVEVEETHARLRNPLFKQLLASEPGRSRNSPANFAEIELYRARLLLACFDCGLTTADLQKVNAELDAIPIHDGALPDWTEGEGISTGLKNIVSAAKAGAASGIVVNFKRLSDGQRDVTAHVPLDGQAQPRNAGHAASDDLAGRTHLGTLVIEATALLAPLLPGERT